MDIIKNLLNLDSEIRYKKNKKKKIKEPLCQAFTLDGSDCKRLASTINYDIKKIIFEYTGYNINIKCCMLCTQHSNILLKEIGKYGLYKIVYSAFRHPYITGISSEDYKALDPSYLEEQLERIKKL